MINKLPDSAKEALLDELIAEYETETALDLIARVRCAKARQSRVRMQSVGVALGIAMVTSICLLLFRSRPSHDTNLTAENKRGGTSFPAHLQVEAASGLSIERLDDEGLLDLLDTAPSALIEWPDGRRSLLLVVGEAQHLPSRAP
jgi:hypothetical protein